MGFDGADLTVREEGYVLPEEVIRRLPEAVKIFQAKGLRVPMITTSVTNANEGHAREIFGAASECGIKYMKLGYWGYGGFGKIKDQMRQMRDDLEGIYALSKEHGVNSAVHIHSGNYLSADAAVLSMLLQGYDPHYLGAYIDPGHMAVEGGLAGWRMGMDLLQGAIRMVAVKDFGWFREMGSGPGQKGWRADIVPLSEGLVPWPEVFNHLHEIGFDGPVSIHSEYEHLPFDGLIRQTKEDLKYLRGVLKGL
jgi:sugar phosphate isomerase/epimerase